MALIKATKTIFFGRWEPDFIILNKTKISTTTSISSQRKDKINAWDLLKAGAIKENTNKEKKLIWPSFWSEKFSFYSYN